ncbi:MAG: hypothetical protein LBH47_01045 [Christensenellaceae bacterium]|jgi:uridine kinase|nr:hypothetical protein [Christensenellaceae bacterium]
MKIILTISGASGSGKTTMCDLLTTLYPNIFVAALILAVLVTDISSVV